MEKPKVILNKKRDFSDVINATFSFISQEIKVYGKLLLYYGGIPILAISIMGAFLSGTELSTIFASLESGGDYDLGLNYQLKVIAANLLNALVYACISGLTFAYLVQYKLYGSGGFQVQDVWKRFNKGFANLFLFGVLLFFISAIVGVVIALIVFLIGTMGGPVVLALVFGIPAFIFMFCVVVYFAVTFSTAGMIIYDENPDFGGIFTRCFELIKGSWWQTFGVLFILMIIYSMVSSLFSIPVLISGVLEGIAFANGSEVIATDSKSFSFVFTSLISTLGSNVLYPVVAIGCGIQYFNLREKRENLDLLGRIEDISGSSI